MKNHAVWSGQLLRLEPDIQNAIHIKQIKKRAGSLFLAIQDENRELAFDLINPELIQQVEEEKLWLILKKMYFMTALPEQKREQALKLMEIDQTGDQYPTVQLSKLRVAQRILNIQPDIPHIIFHIVFSHPFDDKAVVYSNGFDDNNESGFPTQWKIIDKKWYCNLAAE